MTSVPSASVTRPTPSGAGMAATNAPSPASSSAQTSTSIAAPPPERARSRPGFGGVVSSAYRRYSGAVVVVVHRTAPRSVSWWLSGWPVRCAPTTARRWSRSTRWQRRASHR